MKPDAAPAAESSPSSTQRLAINSQVPRLPEHELLRPIGAGASGEVYNGVRSKQFTLVMDRREKWRFPCDYFRPLDSSNALKD